MTAIDAASAAVFDASAHAEPTEQVHVALYSATHRQLTVRGHHVLGNADRAQILRSVVMKPESEALVSSVHARLEELSTIG
jgi:hypothetical protein